MWGSAPPLSLHAGDTPHCPTSPPQVGSSRQKRLPGAGPGTPDFHHHQTQRGFRDSDQGAWKPAVGCGRLREATSGRERVLPGDQLPCDASPSSGQMPRGVKTGQCVVFNGTHRTCEIWSWCPVESGVVPSRPLLAQAQNFTLFIKNTVTFSKFNFSKSNALETWDPTYFKHCRYEPQFSPYCPVFRIGDLVAKAGGTFEDLALLGGSVGIRVHWDCDLDTGDSGCRPHYSFQLQEKSYNFRTATHWWEQPGVEARTLLKLYGIRFDILVTGQAGKFGLIPTAVTLGTGAAWLGVVTFFCDLLLLYVDREAHFYWRTKYEEAKAPKATANSVWRELALASQARLAECLRQSSAPAPTATAAGSQTQTPGWPCPSSDTHLPTHSGSL
ncbi:P2X purinoceptor 6 isoform X4 [Gorilla gorilla gorilla]|uniref:P2X purinoceptor 6 isoform X4 n=2 Tax=Gorilla gorilla gorilla TaxID=9595 RepID=UPI0024460F03|nr:P2X purinoceptor 6 isoform X4 [Gorilla gorilla gorilla]